MIAAISHFPSVLNPKHCNKASSFFKISTKMENINTLKMDSKKKAYWLLKTEPGEWSWADQAANGGLSKWDGVKNKQAQKYMKSMNCEDLCFFYHSGAKFRRVVGVVEVVRDWYEDVDGGGAVDVKAVGEMKSAVGLAEMKRELKGVLDHREFALFRQPRLSVLPVDEKIWDKICEMGGGYVSD